MKRYLFLLFILITSTCLADTIKPPAEALQWWLNSQGKFKGSVVNTVETKDGKYAVTKWNVNGISKPNDVQVEQIMSDFEKQPKTKTLEDRVTELEKKVGIN